MKEVNLHLSLQSSSIHSADWIWKPHRNCETLGSCPPPLVHPNCWSHHPPPSPNRTHLPIIFKGFSTLLEQWPKPGMSCQCLWMLFWGASFRWFRGEHSAIFWPSMILNGNLYPLDNLVLMISPGQHLGLPTPDSSDEQWLKNGPRVSLKS